MLWRISYFLLWQIAGGGLGWWQGGPWGAALGAALAAWAWFVWDLAAWRACAALAAHG